MRDLPQRFAKLPARRRQKQIAHFIHIRIHFI
jgi:hypothetical protein